MAENRMEEFLEEKDVQVYNRGDVLTGHVVQANEQIILVDIGYKSEAQMRPHELAPFREDGVQTGDEVEVIITYIDEEEGTIFVSERQAIYEKRIGELEKQYRKGEAVKGVVEGVVKNAGYHVNLNGIRAFLPGSHLGNDLPSDIEQLRGQEIDLKILELNRRDKNLVVSHKEFLKEKEREQLEQLFEQISVGDVVEGEIKSIVDFGLFVDIGGFEGLVHRTEISWKDLPAPPSTYEVGDTVEVKILDVDKERRRISLSIKQTRPDPWDNIAERYPKDEKFEGEVVALTDFGAFVRLEDDVEGLVHVSELSWGFPENPSEVVQEGDQVEVIVLDVDEQNRRISLSMRQAQADPWADIEEKYPEGAIVTGTVTKLLDFGAFVQLEEGVEALLHISEMSWERINHPNEVVSEGDELELKVIKSDGQRRKIRLSLREMQEDPWHTFVEEYPVGTVIDGEITELKDFGAFCKITDEVEGLIHVSEIAEEHVDQPSDVLDKGQGVEARIIGINEEKRQVRLSLRNVHEPHEAEKQDRQPQRQQPQQQQRPATQPSRTAERRSWPPEPTKATASSSTSSVGDTATEESGDEAEESATGHEALTMRELLKRRAEEADLDDEEADVEQTPPEASEAEAQAGVEEAEAEAAETEVDTDTDVEAGADADEATEAEVSAADQDDDDDEAAAASADVDDVDEADDEDDEEKDTTV